MFNVHTVLQAFAMIDQNRDGLIDVSDLRAIYMQIGKTNKLLSFLAAVTR